MNKYRQIDWNNCDYVITVVNAKTRQEEKYVNILRMEKCTSKAALDGSHHILQNNDKISTF